MTTSHTTRFKSAREVGPGDVIVFGGRPHLIATVEAYEHPTIDLWMVKASAADGWYIILEDGPVEVAG